MHQLPFILHSIILKTMVPLYLIIIAMFCLFFIVHFFLTQRIYSKNSFILLTVLSLTVPVIIFFLVKKDNRINAINFGLILFYYNLVLLTVKMTYKSINNFLINKKLVDIVFMGKDFTYVFWDGDIPTTDDIWNKKLASKPSWLDHTFTLALLIFPILLTVLINLIK